MIQNGTSTEPVERPATLFLVAGLALLVAVLSARPYAGSWNDGSRLATVECLVDYHTLAIDRSIFVDVPPQENPAVPSPYADDENLRLRGTGDKLFIRGHYYSDKSPVPALWLAGVYQLWQWCTGWTARARPEAFCYVMTLASSGLAYVLAVCCLYQLGRPLHLSGALRLTITTSFALATVALTYVEYVNNHIFLLGTAAALFLGLAQWAEARKVGKNPWRWLLALGSLTGLAYTMDLGAGPVLLLCMLALVAYRCRQLRALLMFGLAAMPWVLLHHLLNYRVGGTLKPANAVAEYFAWPGCSFSVQNMTGTWQHASVGHFLLYAAALLLGKRGFLGHNLPLLLVLPALFLLLRRRRDERPELLTAAGWCGGTWLLYALTSNNSSGLCCSIRWFVPLLAPGYFVLSIFLRECPRWQGAFLLLSSWGGVLAGLMWWQGPWMKHLVPLYWPIQAAALLTLAVSQNRQRGVPSAEQPGSERTYLLEVR